ncbi:MarR family transcriptional regulator [Xenophilus sp. AP218F]|nr:MarR family transcriptional regulator [Xenophilus sp. AP218F]
MSQADRVLHLLKTRGEQTAQALAETLALTTMGARKHLQALQEAGLATASERACGVGRPAQYWRLTHAGHARFPDRHADLGLQLLHQTRELFGEAGLAQVIAGRERQLLAAYLPILRAEPDPARRVARLAELRGAEGYMAKVEAREPGWRLSEDHCPICAAASQCRSLCDSELRLFGDALGPAFGVERVEHVLDGGRRCVYAIRLLAEKSAP